MKKLISILLITAMLFSMILAAIPASAQSKAENVSVLGTDTETGKLAAEAPAVPGDFDGNGETDEDAVAIDSWAKFREVFSGEGSHKGYLTTNLTATLADAQAPATQNSAWRLCLINDTLYKDAYFDGNGKTVTFDASSTNGSGDSVMALFYNSAKTLTLKNLNIAGSVKYSTDSGCDLGLVIRRNFNEGASLENVVISANITVAGSTTNLGGIGAAIGVASSTTTTLTNVHYTGAITVSRAAAYQNSPGNGAPAIGGLVGRNAAVNGGGNTGCTLTMTNCSMTGSITVSGQLTQVAVGGILGRSDGTTTIKNCKNAANITVENIIDAGVGGILGSAYSDARIDYTLKIDACTNNGAITVNNACKCGVGGILGQAIRNSLSKSFAVNIENNCVNSGNVSVKASNHCTVDFADNKINDYGHRGIGGLVGYLCQVASGTVNGKNSGDISFGSNTNGVFNVQVGGVIGSVYEVTSSFAATNCENSGSVSLSNASRTSAEDSKSTGGIVGGIFGGSQEGNISYAITNCVNDGKVSGMGPLGGILGGTRAMGGTATITLTLSGCKNRGWIYNTGTADWVLVSGGIVGNLSMKKITGEDFTYTTEFSFTAENCYNLGDVTGNPWALGGIIGQWDSAGVAPTKASVISKCVNAGKVANTRNPGDSGDNNSAWNTCSGIIGMALNNANIDIKDCINMGAVSTDNASGYGAFPIINCVKSRMYDNSNTCALPTVTASGNIFASDSVKGRADGTSWHSYSTSADAAGIRAKLDTFTDYSAADRNLLKNTLSSAFLALCEEIETQKAYKATLIETAYSVETWNAFTKAISDAEELLLQDNVSDNAFNAQKEALISAKEGLKAPDYNGLQDAIGAAKAKVETDYSVEDWNAIQSAIGAAEAVNTRSQTEINAAVETLNAAVNGKTPLDRSALQAAIAEARAITDTGYTTESWTALQNAITAAENAVSARTQSEIDAAKDNLDEAVEELVEPNYDALNAAISAAKAKVQTDYSVEDWNAIQSAIGAAEAVNTRSQTEINAAVETLNEAVNGKTPLDRSALQAAIAEARAITDTGYTTESWTALQNAITAAENAVSARTQSEIDAAKDNLDEAVEGLAEPNYDALNAEIERAVEYNESDLEEEEWNSLQSALTAANAVKTSKSQTEIDNAVKALQIAIDALEGLNREELRAAIDIANDKVETDYTTDSWQAFAQALAAARTVLEESRVQTAINNAVETLNTAMSNLKNPNYEALQSAIAAAKAKVENDYTVEDWNAIQSAIDAAEEKLESRTQSEIDGAVEVLNSVVNSKTPLDRSALQAAINAAKAKLEKDYTVEDWQAIVAAIATAEADASRTQGGIDAAVEALNSVVNSKTPLDRSALAAAINAAKAKVQTEYTTESWSALQSAISAAEADASRTQTAIDAAVEALNAVVEALVAPDYDELEAAIDAAKAKVETDYTAQTWAALTAALATAEEKLESRTQADIDAAVETLVAAVEALVEAEDDNTGDGNTGDDNTGDGNTGDDNTDDEGNSSTEIDYAALEEAIAECEKLNKSGYTESSWAEMQAALVQAKKALVSQNQTEIDAATANLKAKIAALQKGTAADNSDNTPDDTSADDSEGKTKRSCKSSISAGALIVSTVLVLGAGVTFKKKED